MKREHAQLSYLTFKKNKKAWIKNKIYNITSKSISYT